jgi:hypothetical protein
MMKLSQQSSCNPSHYQTSQSGVTEQAEVQASLPAVVGSQSNHIKAQNQRIRLRMPYPRL